jgi:hypothetical protein
MKGILSGSPDADSDLIEMSGRKATQDEATESSG